MTSVVGKKTEVAGFQVFGGSISGLVQGLNEDYSLPYAVVAIDGVNTTQTDKKGIYYVNFNTFPSKHTIEIIHDLYIYDPIEVTVTEDTRQLPTIKASATYVCGWVEMINFDEDKYERSKRPRTIRCLQEPNPLELEDWDTPGI